MRIDNVSKIYKTRYEDVTALKNINLILPEKGLVFIVGVSGSGKTTLMNMLSRVDEPTTGDVIIGDKSLFAPTKEAKKQMYGYRNSYVGLIFQDYNLIEDLNVYDNIKLSLDLMGRKDYEVVDEVIKKIDIEDIKYSNVNEISSGQMQRVAIARALVKGSSIILADEPTGNLDTKNEKIIFDILKEISKERLVVVITHDGDAAIEYGDRIIEIEDGNIYSDNNPLTEDTVTESPEFIEPKINFFQQCKFTLGFIKHNYFRSLAIFLVILLIPIIGGILAGYVNFDVGISYRQHQEKYGSEYITLSQPVGDYNLYYEPDEIVDVFNSYQRSKLIEYYDTYLNINPSNKKVDFFYKPVITNIVLYNSIFPLEGRMPQKNTEILVTDYIIASIQHYQEKTTVDKVTLDGITYSIVGIIDTDYEKFIDADFSDEYVRMAFNENLTVYNAIFTTYEGYAFMMDNLNSYHEIVRHTVYGGVIPKTKYDEIMVYRGGSKNVNVFIGTNIVSYRAAIVSSAFYEEALQLNYDAFGGNQTATLYCYSKSNYRISFRIVGVFESDQYEIIIDSNDFDNNMKKINHSRLLLPKDDVNYRKIVNNENVTNESFKYAKAMAMKAKDAKIVMIEAIVVLVLIVITFSAIMNNMTIQTEKKKIGIKYSFGLKKSSIVIPYILEYLGYIIISLIVSCIVVKWGFIFFMKNVIYTHPEDIKVFDFFYISWSTIFSWNFTIYLLMVISLGIMIFNICKKSPIEIIKDL